VFEAIRTERLLIRQMTADDAESLWERRNEPDVAKYQNWSTPYPREDAERIAVGVGEMDGPENGEWWMASLEDADGTVIGDLALHLSENGHTAEVGYTLHPDRWVQGYAVEALEALVAYLFETLDITRAFGMLHPDNPPSAQVLERVGMLFEGHTRKSFWLDGEVSDDWIYGMLREDWEAWRDRPRTPPQEVRLVEVTKENLRAVYDMVTHKTQENFVAPNPKSLVQGHMAKEYEGHPMEAWFRAIEADGDLVGFVMVALVDNADEPPFLWRLLIDRMHQRRGIAGMALDHVEEFLRSRGEETFLTSWIPGRGSPEPFYYGRGFVPTGEVHDEEIIGKKSL
jgi:RimJ/RimL family protein N-acetyltransferase